jgi:hypothetical protein
LNIKQLLRDKVFDFAVARGATLSDLTDWKIDAYLTEQLDVLAISYALKYRVVDISQPDGDTLPEALLIVSGDYTSDLEGKALSDIPLRGIRGLGPSGETIGGLSMVSVYGAGVLGVRMIPYWVRHPL